MAGDAVVESGVLKLDVPPRGRAELQAPFRKPKPAPGVEYWLLVEFTLPEDTLWAKKGHEVAFAQFKLPFSAPAAPLRLEALPGLIVQETEKLVTVSGKEFVYTFDKPRGTFTSLRYAGVEILGSGPALNVWRAPTFG